MRVTCVAPHPDDESIGCGGILAKMAAQGWDVTVLWVSEPETEVRATEARAALAELGVGRSVALGLPSFGLTYDRSGVEALIDAFRTTRPDVLLYPHGAEDDRAHRAVHALADEASWLSAYDAWPARGRPLERRPGFVLQYEVWTPIAKPTHVEDITAWMPHKLRAIRAYQSQLAHTPLDAAAEGLARYRAAMAGRGDHAEAFSIQVHDGDLLRRIEGARQ